VKLDIGSHVYALVDHSGLIQREAREKRATLGASGYGNGNGNANAKPQGRFQKRQREDGSHLALRHVKKHMFSNKNMISIDKSGIEAWPSMGCRKAGANQWNQWNQWC
jgi:hypothetical protein